MPMIETQPDAAARVYAKSLLELATQQGGQAKVEETLGELEEIIELARGDAKFAEFLSSRSLGSDARRDSISPARSAPCPSPPAIAVAASRWR